MKYAHDRDGTKILPPEGWCILPEGERVPNIHREFVHMPHGGFRGWCAPRRCISTMTAITAHTPWGAVYAYAVPTKNKEIT